MLSVPDNKYIGFQLHCEKNEPIGFDFRPGDDRGVKLMYFKYTPYRSTSELVQDLRADNEVKNHTGDPLRLILSRVALNYGFYRCPHCGQSLSISLRWPDDWNYHKHYRHSAETFYDHRIISRIYTDDPSEGLPHHQLVFPKFYGVKFSRRTESGEQISYLIINNPVDGMAISIPELNISKFVIDTGAVYDGQYFRHTDDTNETICLTTIKGPEYLDRENYVRLVAYIVEDTPSESKHRLTRKKYKVPKVKIPTLDPIEIAMGLLIFSIFFPSLIKSAFYLIEFVASMLGNTS